MVATIHTLTRTGRRYNLNEVGSVSAGSWITSVGTTGSLWADRVVANGGARPSQTTIDIADNFILSCSIFGFQSKLRMVNIFAPDNLIACCTPLFSNEGTAAWTNNNFLDGDLSVNGLTGNGSTKYLQTAFNPTSHFASATNAGWSSYVVGGSMPGVGSEAVTMGCSDATNNMLNNFYNNGVGGQTYLYTFNSTAGTTSPVSVVTGFFTGETSASNSQVLYKNKSVYISSTYGGSALINVNITAFAEKTNTSVIRKYAPWTIAFLSCHDFLNGTEVGNFNDAVKVMRTKFGGTAP